MLAVSQNWELLQENHYLVLGDGITREGNDDILLLMLINVDNDSIDDDEEA